jgi:hypothetical protein
MIGKITSFIRGSRGEGAPENDFSAFFSKSAGEKTKVIRQVLREANEEQRRIVHGAHV